MTLEEAKKRDDYRFWYVNSDEFDLDQFLEECCGSVRLYDKLSGHNDRYVTFCVRVGSVDIELNAWFAKDWEETAGHHMVL